MADWGGTSVWNTPAANWVHNSQSGVAAGAPVVPAGSRLECISLYAGGAAAATWQIGAGPVRTVPAGGWGGEDFEVGLLAPPGGITITIAGDVAAWVVTYRDPP